MSSKVVSLTEITDPLGYDIEYHVDDPAGTPLDRKVYSGSKNLLPDGYMINGKLSVTVASNNLTVALKTKSGGNPSATDPVSVWINGTYRRCTAALSVTTAAATNWMGLGGASFAALEQDLFAYLIWNTTPATDIVDIAFSRFPNFRVYSDGSGTTTNEKYIAFANASTPTSTDSMVNIGRFAATLSAGAGYTWTVPTFTNSNLIQAPTYESRLLTYVPTWAASGTAVALGNGVLTGSYKINGRSVTVRFSLVAGNTTTFGTGTYSWASPFAPAVFSIGAARITDTGTLYYLGVPEIVAAGTTFSVYANALANSAGQTIPMTWANTDTIYAQCEIGI